MKMIERINHFFALELFLVVQKCFVTECWCIVQILLSPFCRLSKSLICVSVLVTEGLLTFQVGTDRSKS